jgi:hypothetical protein
VGLTIFKKTARVALRKSLSLALEFTTQFLFFVCQGFEDKVLPDTDLMKATVPVRALSTWHLLCQGERLCLVVPSNVLVTGIQSVLFGLSGEFQG